MISTIHEMRNQLAVAVASIEAFIDGKLEPTPARLRSVSEALGEIDVLLNAIVTRPEAALDGARIAAVQVTAPEKRAPRFDGLFTKRS